MKTEPKTKVIFRVFKEGDVIALFPAISDSVNGYLCLSYQHIGQHGSADPMITNNTRLAKPAEYADLLAELKQTGYNLQIVKRFTQKDYETRKLQYAK